MIENNQEVVDNVSRDEDDEDNNGKLDAGTFTKAFTLNLVYYRDTLPEVLCQTLPPLGDVLNQTVVEDYVDIVP